MTSVSKEPPSNQGQDQGQVPLVIFKPISHEQSKSEQAQRQGQGGAQQVGPFQQQAAQNPPHDSGGIPNHNPPPKDKSSQAQGESAPYPSILSINSSNSCSNNIYNRYNYNSNNSDNIYNKNFSC